MKIRDKSLDIAKAVLIILMVIGHAQIPVFLNRIIYSFHMVAFVFYSGFCFDEKASDNLRKTIVRLVKTFLLPYGIWGISHILIAEEGIISEAKNILFGMNQANKFFTDRTSVAQVYFLLLLFTIRVIYLLLHKLIKNVWVLSIVILLLSLVGVFLSSQGYWLPWCFDCSLFAIVFYHIGFIVKKYDVLVFFRINKACYVIMFFVWFFMILSGGMELVTRNYGNYFITIAGAVSATILLYEICRIIVNVLPNVIVRMLTIIGENTVDILLVHTILGGYITLFIAHSLVAERFWDATVVIIIQIALGTMIGYVIKKRKHL